MAVSDITKPQGVGTLEAPGVSLSTQNYGQAEITVGSTEVFVIRAGMMEMPNNPFTVELGGTVPDGGTVEWFLDDVSQGTLAHDASFTPAAAGILTAQFLLDSAPVTTVPLPIYAHDMAMPGMSPSHMADENAVLGLVRHHDATAIAVQDGDWTDPATWSTGAIPDFAARVLVPMGRAVTYDGLASPRLHSVRIDGLLSWAVDRDTNMLVEHLIETKPGTMRIGTRANPLPLQYNATITTSNRVALAGGDTPSDMDLAADPRLIGRGVISMGSAAVYGFHRARHVRTAPLNLPLAGDTSVTLATAPTGWQVGDRILVPRTVFDLDNGQTISQDEYRVITDITGAVVSWDVNEPLMYDHDHHNSAFAQEGIWQLPIINRETNIVFQSEEGKTIEAWQRGHIMVMHTKQADFWDAGIWDMTRTDKRRLSGIINASGDFEFPEGSTNTVLTAPLTAQSNLQGRYSFHIHFPGFDKDKVATGYYLHIEGSIGWALVHHGGRAGMVGCTMHDFIGAGMVSESANELGRWHDCVAAGVNSPVADTTAPKGSEGKRGIQGDFGHFGVGFEYRGRDMVVTDCTAIGCAWGHNFYHRANNPNVSLPIDPFRVHLDSHDLAWFSRDQNDRIKFVHRPITHFDGCQSIGCFGGLNVVKAGPAHLHDLNIQIKGFVAWGVRTGVILNYIGGYQVEAADLTSTAYPGLFPQSAFQHNGIDTGKSLQVAIYGTTTRGFTTGIRLSEEAVGGVGNSNFSMDDPKFMVKDHISIGETTALEYEGNTDGTNAVDVTWIAPPGHVDAAAPTLGGPFVIADWDGGSTFTNNQMPLIKADSTSSLKQLPKPWDPAGVIDQSRNLNTVIRLRDIRDNFGYYMYDGEPHIVGPVYFSDGLTARMEKSQRAFRFTGDPSSYTNLGTLTYSATPITANDFAVSVEQDQSVSFNVLTLSDASGEAGATLTLGDPHMTAFVNTGDPLADPTPYEPAHFKPNRGDITIAQNGDITYTALPHDQPATDDMLVSIYDGRGRWKTVEIVFDITVP